jgi:hypothetical protein
MRSGIPVAAAGSAALAEEAAGGEVVQALNHDRTAVFADSQDVRDTPAAHMTGQWGRSFGAAPQAPENFPDD